MKRWAFLFLISLVASSAHAAIVEQDVPYILSDHPDAALTDLGLANPITYGLRLDSLGGSAAERTFSTTQDGAFVTLLWSGTQVTIEGQVSRNSDNSLWDVSYILEGVTATGTGFEVLASGGGGGSGVISNDDNSFEFDLFGKAGNDVIFTALGDGHRCDDPQSGVECTTDRIGRGWLKVYEQKDSYKKDITHGYNDWLVQLTPVPVPAALPLMLSGLLGFAFFSRKKPR